MLVECKTIRYVVSLAVEVERAGVFTNAKLALPIRHALEDGLVYPQPPTPLKSDNFTTTGFVNNNMHQRRLKSWGVRHHWLREKETQKLIRVHWDKGSNNLADYYTKHHPTKYHLEMRTKINSSCRAAHTQNIRLCHRCFRSINREGVFIRHKSGCL